MGPFYDYFFDILIMYSFTTPYINLRHPLCSGSKFLSLRYLTHVSSLDIIIVYKLSKTHNVIKHITDR